VQEWQNSFFSVGLQRTRKPKDGSHQHRLGFIIFYLVVFCNGSPPVALVLHVFDEVRRVDVVGLRQLYHDADKCGGLVKFDGSRRAQSVTRASCEGRHRDVWEEMSPQRFASH
jgi:hypothetical protein